VGPTKNDYQFSLLITAFPFLIWNPFRILFICFQKNLCSIY
jgi:hypothetical protein